jgi:hypothetical protein
VAIKQITTVVSQAMRENDTRVSCRTSVTAALTPELAIAYVRALSADVRAAVVLDAGGSRLAGPVALEAPARVLLAAAGEAADVAVRTPDGLVLAARTPAHAIVVAAGPLSLVGPSAIDARRAVEGLTMDGAPPAPAVPPPGGPAEASADLHAAARAVISATHGAI